MLLSSFFFFVIASWQLPVVTIEEIEISGNIKTRDSEVLRLSQLSVGDELTPTILNRSKNSLLSASIFESANVVPFPGSKKDKVKIAITVKEKMSWFVVPNLSYSSSGFGGGAAYGESNFFGRSKKVLVGGYLSSKNRTLIVGYRDPSLAGSSATLAVDGLYRWDTMIEYSKGNESRRARLIEYGTTVMPGIQWSAHFNTSIGIFFRKVKQDLISQTADARPLAVDSLRNGNDISAVANFTYQDSTTINGLFKGFELGLESQISDNRFLSDYEYFRQILRFKWGFLFWNERLSYVNNISAQFGRTLPYYRELMVGGDNLRGYKNREFRGDTRYSLNHEILAPLYSFKRVITRAAIFWDSSIMYFKDQQFTRDAWRNGLGIGARVYFKGIAIPLVGYDLGWGLEHGSFDQYINVGVSF